MTQTIGLDSWTNSQRLLDNVIVPVRDNQIQEQESRLTEKPAPDNWRDWTRELFPGYITAPFAERHEELWDWGWAIERGERTRPFIAIWPRGGAKSTTAEMLTVYLGAEDKRGYTWYVCETQDQADKHIETIAEMIESSKVEEYYPQFAERKVGKYGHSRGWRRNRLRTASGFTIDGMGLDKAVRGSRIEEQRPDFMVFDDVDGELDSALTTEKKIKILTKSLLPAGSNNLVVLGIQNLIIPDGIFAQLSDGRADFLSDRILSGPYPAIEGLEVEQTKDGFVITSGTATWKGQDRETCQAQIRQWGYSSFLAEAQHEVDAPPGGMFDHLEYRRCNWDEVPWGSMERVSVWVDPAVTATDQSDSMGIQADGVTGDYTLYRLWSWEQVSTPQSALEKAITKAVELGSHTVGVETDQGGDTWISVYRLAVDSLVDKGRIKREEAPAFQSEKAGAGHGPKVHRAHQMLTDYERGRIIHVNGTHQTLEKALNRFPKTKPFDLVDAAYWSWNDLMPNSGPLLLFGQDGIE